MANTAQDALCFATTDAVARVLSQVTRDEQDAVLLYLWQVKLCALLGIAYDPLNPILRGNTGDWNGRQEQARINAIAAMAIAVLGTTPNTAAIQAIVRTILKNFSKDQRDASLSLAICGCWANGLAT